MHWDSLSITRRILHPEKRNPMRRSPAWFEHKVKTIDETITQMIISLQNVLRVCRLIAIFILCARCMIIEREMKFSNTRNDVATADKRRKCNEKAATRCAEKGSTYTKTRCSDNTYYLESYAKLEIGFI
jgi:hypothetical protein